ncbi:protein PALS2-like [Ruditapes philippinarum]|uniref:protein PALS2-like n=1 Tax=Ruditapes philippinarum TaxID=129788 RepID=UPI00295C1B59|nr:protein PALS2-like [Ruditapes philippinarum]
MPAASNTEDESGLVAVRTLQNNLDRLQDATDAPDSEIDFLSKLLSDPILQSIVDTQDKLEDQPEVPANVHAGKLVTDVYNALGDLVGTNRNAEELDRLLSDTHFKAILDAHDDIIDRNFEEIPAVEDQPIFQEQDQGVFNTVNDQIRLVGIMKSDTEPLGITVKIDETGDLTIARIMAGSMSDKLGLLHVGDIIKEVNGIPVFTPQQLMDIIRNADRSITLKIVPTYIEQHHTSQMFYKAHFNYNPQNDRLIPSKEAGLAFQDGDILHIYNHDDSNWWQAQIVGDETNRVGLIPSKNLEENRKAFVRSDMDYSKSSLLCGLKRKKKKKIKYSTTNNKDYDAADLVLYEEVTRMPPFQRKTLVLVGANGVGRRSLKERLIKSDPRRFASALPHTSRPPREGEVHGKKYFFTDRETMDMEIQNDLYLEFGVFNGNLYGTKLETIHDTIRSGKMCVLDVNPTSLKVLKNPEFMPYIIFIAAPSAEALMVMYEDGRRKGVGRGIAGPGTIDFKTEEDFLKIIEESAQIEKVYKSCFDMTIVNDSFDETFREIRQIVDSLSTDTQWVPVNWVY